MIPLFAISTGFRLITCQSSSKNIATSASYYVIKALHVLRCICFNSQVKWHGTWDTQPIKSQLPMGQITNWTKIDLQHHTNVIQSYLVIFLLCFCCNAVRSKYKFCLAWLWTICSFCTPSLNFCTHRHNFHTSTSPNMTFTSLSLSTAKNPIIPCTSSLEQESTQTTIMELWYYAYLCSHLHQP